MMLIWSGVGLKHQNFFKYLPRTVKVRVHNLGHGHGCTLILTFYRHVPLVIQRFVDRSVKSVLSVRKAPQNAGLKNKQEAKIIYIKSGNLTIVAL